jgi:WD repeat-containing protein 42A
MNDSKFSSLLSSLRMREMSPLYPASTLRSVWAHYAVEKLTCESVLAGHRGCVNTVLFSWDGNTIYTGSDDTYINIYDTYPAETAPTTASAASSMERFPTERCRIKTKHTNNIFYVKDLPSSGGNKLVTCAADGKVILMTLDEGRYESVQIARHAGRAHRLAIHPYLPNQIYSCGEDGKLNFIDIRQGHISDVAESGHYFNFQALKDQGCVNAGACDRGVMTTSFRAPNANARSAVSSIYCISVNPFKEYEVACSGESSAVALYDTRSFAKPFGYLMPNHLRGEGKHISGVKHDCTGREIIASYNDEDIYSFNIAEHLIAADSPNEQPGHARQGKRKFQESTGESCDSSGAMSIIDETGHATDTSAAAGGERDEEDRYDEFDSYSDEDDSRDYRRRFTGHRNYLTVKQVAYYGQSSEFVVSGSDCGNIFLWDSRTGNIVRTLFADKRGATNCLAAHPFDTLLASSGLEHTAKLWSSVGKKVSMSEQQVAQSVSQIVETNVSNASTLRERSNNPIESILASLFDSPSFAARFPGFSHQAGSDSESDDDMLLPRSIAHPEEFQLFVSMMRNMIQNSGDSSEESEGGADASDSEEGEDSVARSDNSASVGDEDDNAAEEASVYTSIDSRYDSQHSNDVDSSAEEEDILL